MRLTTMATTLGAGAAMVAATLVAVPVAAGAAIHSGQVTGVESRCADSPYHLCLYYSSSTSNSAWWGTSRAVWDLGNPPQYFTGPGEGAGQPVKDNAASIFCDMTTRSICYVYDRAGFIGAADLYYGQRSGLLSGTYKHNGSVNLSYGA
jgi:hypothetical protein